MANIQQKIVVGVGLGVGLVFAIGSTSGYFTGVNNGTTAERNRITQDLQNHQYGLLRDAEFVYRATPVQDSLLRDAHSVEYVINRLKKVKK